MSDGKSGSVLGGMLLISGSCIGAGMLGLPILTGIAGFFPALFMFFCAWIFMTLTALLLVEVNGWFTSDVNLSSMIAHTLGRFGKALGWILYLFLFYALLVAYTAASGGILSAFLPIPNWMASLFFVVLFGWIVYLGTRPVDLWNRALMVALILAYVALISSGIGHVDPRKLLYTDASYSLYALPLLITSFGFHNMIPSLTNYMKGDLKRVRLAILSGSLLSLVIYLLWEIVVLGIVPPEEIASCLKLGKEGSQALAAVLGSSWITTFAQLFALFAILTSFLAQSLSLVHFLADAIKLRIGKHENIGLCVLALAPPLILALLYPQLFFKALNFAGGVCASILFGVFPACMVWLGRYRKQISAPYRVQGGKPLLCAIFLFALFILSFQISTMIGP